MQQSRSRHRLLTFFVELLFAILIIGGSYLLAVSERQNVYDWLKLRGYHAPSEVASLASQDTMTAYARKMFYVNHPVVDSKAAFASVCPNGTEQTVVLGCYHSNETGIYLLSVNNADLNGIQQVTAAHETLHAIYGQLSTKERKYVDGLLLAYYNHGLNDPNIEAQIASYRKTEPNAIVNEMHSLFGTEVANLPPALEAYYSKYFTNRQAVVDDYLNYQQAFTSRENEITTDNGQLSALDAQINSDNNQLNSQLSSIASDQKTLEQEQSSGDITSYNQGVPAYNQMVHQYNDLVGTVQSLVSQYNSLVDSRNSIVLEEQQLVQAISSTKQTIKN